MCRDDDEDGFWVGPEDCRRCPDGSSPCPEDLDDSQPSVYPNAPEVCDGRDNDGDGLFDQEDRDFVLPPECPLQAGVCEGARQVCQGEAGPQPCDAEAYGPDYAEEEFCGDGLDNDCDGVADVETCDGLDEDCDDEVDEDVDCGACGPEGVETAAGTCVDRWEVGVNDPLSEARPLRGLPPRANVSYEEAAAHCRDQGKTLCPKSVWETACRGSANTAYPYGADFEAGRCNDSGAVAPTGGTPGCESAWPEGVLFDMTGNVAEWVRPEEDPRERLVAGGGYASVGGDSLGCGAFAPGPGEEGADGVGFRCCWEL